jgi:hypothetical protein
MRLMLRVDQTFAVRERGVVVAPFLPVAELADVRFGVKVRVELRRPDGTRQTVLGSMNIPRIVRTEGPRLVGCLLLHDIDKSDVPIGSEVWFEPESDPPCG